MSASSQGQEAKVARLLVTVNDSLKAGKQGAAALALREAVTLSPEDDRVKKAFQSLEISHDPASDLQNLASSFAAHPEDDSSASSLTKTAASGRYTLEQAEKALCIMFNVANDNITKNQAVTSIVTNENGQKVVAILLRRNATETFQELWNCGDTVINAVIAIAANVLAWPAEEDRLVAERDVFLLLLAKLLEPAQEASGMGMRAMARLLAVDATNIAPLIDASNFEIILSMLDVQHPVAIRSQATLVTAKFLETEPIRGQKLLTDYVVSRAGKANIDDLVAAFSVAAAIFPVLPAAAATMFMTPGFLDDLVGVTKKTNSARLGRASLELLSAACVDKTCRESISDKCASWLQEVMQEKARFQEEGNNLDAALASLILCKIQIVPNKNGEAIHIVAVASFLKSLIQDTDSTTVQTAVEGLAYASVQGKVKEDLMKDATFLSTLLALLRDPEEKGLVFGGLTIISNLTVFRPVRTAEQAQINQLKAYANQSSPEAADLLNGDEYVTARCKKFIDAGVVPILVDAIKKASPTLLKIISTICFSLTKNTKHCGLLVQQGLFDTILRLANIRTTAEVDTAVFSTIHHSSSHALARILIPLDPSLIFNNTSSQDRPLASAIKPLSTLLGASPETVDADSANTFTTNEQVDKVATFDALRALTNIASLSDHACEIIVTTCFPQIEALLWSRVSAIAQAATELILNLTQSPSAASKFFSSFGANTNTDHDGTEVDKAEIAAARGRLTLLFALTTSETRGTALAATAAMSNILAYEAGAASFLELTLGSPNPNPTKANAPTKTLSTPSQRLISLTQEAHSANNSDMLARALTALCALIATGGNAAKKQVKDAGVSQLFLRLLKDKMVATLGMTEMVSDAMRSLEVA